jgi:hypothetical protein
MNNDQAIRVLDTLSQGVNPFTGEIFPDDSPYQHPTVVRALTYAVGCCKGQRPRTSDVPVNAGKPWTAEEDARLASVFKSGERSSSKIARDFGRTAAGIEARLERLKLIEPHRFPSARRGVSS